MSRSRTIIAHNFGYRSPVELIHRLSAGTVNPTSPNGSAAVGEPLGGVSSQLRNPMQSFRSDKRQTSGNEMNSIVFRKKNLREFISIRIVCSASGSAFFVNLFRITTELTAISSVGVFLSEFARNIRTLVPIIYRIHLSLFLRIRFKWPFWLTDADLGHLTLSIFIAMSVGI